MRATALRMDLIDNLRARNRGSGTAKKVKERGCDSLPLVTGTGFLFGNSVLRRVKSRLGDDENHEADSTKSPIDNGCCDLSQTQVVGLAYDGEDLEQDFADSTARIEGKSWAGPTNKPNYPKDKRRVSSNNSTVERRIPRSELESTEVNTQLISPHQVKEIDELETQLLLPDVDLHPTNQSSNNTILDGTITQISGFGETCHDNAIQATSKDVSDTSTFVPITTKTKYSNSSLSFNANDPEEESNTIAMSPADATERDRTIRKRFDAQSFIESFDDETDELQSCAASNASETEAPVLKQLEDGEKNANNLKKPTHFESNRENNPNKDSSSIKIFPTMFEENKADASAIILSSSSEEEEDYESKKPSFKAAILDLKARLSKKSQSLLIPRSKVTSNFSSHQILFASLRKANKSQILDYRKEKYQSKGIDYDKITEEKNSIESLLERELARNKKIRLREIEQERQNERKDFGEQSSAFDYSNDELEEEPSDEEIDENQSSSPVSLHSGIVCADDAVECAANRMQDLKQTIKPNEEEDAIRKSGLRKHKKFCLIDTDEEDGSVLNSGNIIDLGAYGSNIGNLNQIEQEQVGEHVGAHIENDLTTTGRNKNLIKPSSRSSSFQVEDNSHEDMNPGVIRELIEKHKRKELLREAKLEKLHQSKASRIIDYEAEESDDEWHGIGGVDGERFDDHDSDLEKMIDDYSNSRFDSSEVRKRQIEEEISEDKSMVNKILHDIETGGFRKRGRNALDLELSDDDDEELLKYHSRRKELLRQKVSAQGEAKLLAENPKSKAFFETIVEDIRSKGALEDEGPPPVRGFSSVNAPEEKNSDSDKKGKKTVLSEAFVQQTLSFLTSGEVGEEKGPENNLGSLPTHVPSFNTEETQDIFALKQNSSIKSLSAPTRNSSNMLIDDQEDLLSRKRACSFFARFTKRVDANEKFEEGKKTVRSLNSYKVAGSSKASITYLGKARKLNAPKKVAHQQSRKRGHKPAAGFGIFASNSESFES